MSVQLVTVWCILQANLVTWARDLRLVDYAAFLKHWIWRWQIPVAERSKARVYGRWLAGIAGSNTAGGHWCLSLVSVVCCQVEVSATSLSLVQRSPTDCGASLCVIYNLRAWAGPDPRWAVAPVTIWRCELQYAWLWIQSKGCDTGECRDVVNSSSFKKFV